MGQRVEVRKRDAEKVLAAVRKAFAGWVTATGSPPKLVKNWQYREGSDPTPYAILWEEGPYEWPMLFSDLSAGYETTDQEYGIRLKPVTIPTNVNVEVIFSSWAIGIYPN